MLNKALQKELEKGLPGSLYYLWSEESFFLEDALSRFVETVIASDSPDFNYDVFDTNAEVQEIIDALWTLPFMAKRRLVVLKNFHQFPASGIKVLMKYFKDPSETTCAVILSRKPPKASWKVKWKDYSLIIREKDVPSWLKSIAVRKGIRLTDDAVNYLIEFVGYDTGLLIMEIEKLTLSGKKTISGEDILASTSMMRKYTSFDLVDSLISGQKTRAFRILKTMFERNAMEAPVIIGTLNWHYKQFYLLWINKGKKPLKMRERTYRTLVRYLPCYSEEDFYNIFRELHEADLGIKTSSRSEIVIEALLIRLLQKEMPN